MTSGGGGHRAPAAMLRPSFPGGHPYPPRPGEPPAGVRYVFPPGAGAAAGGPPPASPYTGREAASVYGRQVRIMKHFS